MLDHHDTRGWADTHDQLAAWLDDLVTASREAFEALHDRQWQAPWTPPAAPDRPR